MQNGLLWLGDRVGMRAGIIGFLLNRERKLFQEFQGISPSSSLK